MTDSSALISLALEWGPAILIVLLAAWVIMAVSRFLKRLFTGGRSRSAAAPPQPYPAQERRDPILGSAAPAVSTIPDAADVLALKASIDALARQIAALEKRLAPVEPAQAESRDLPAVKGAEVIPMAIDPGVPPGRRKG
jgi:hypothetical protein